MSGKPASSNVAVIVGAGAGLSASLARQCAAAGMRVALAARDIGKLKELERSAGARLYACDATDAAQVESLFARTDADLGPPALVLYNASFRVRGPVETLVPTDVMRALTVTAFGAFLVAQAAAKRMIAAGQGSLCFTGASASTKGYPESSPFAMGKFAVRGLAQSLARELGPKGIHVAHFVIDGSISKTAAATGEDRQLSPEAIARTYLEIHGQHRSAWTFEVDLRPWVERF